jgi:membrane protease YdiL (CAAX protease family)
LKKREKFFSIQMMKPKYRVVVVSFLSVGWFNFLFLYLARRPEFFWLAFPLGLVVLLVISAALERQMPGGTVAIFRQVPKALVAGILSAVALYVIFLLGRQLLGWVFAGSLRQIQGVYGLKEGQSAWKVGLLLALFVGPGEELLWRGYLQRRWCELLGGWQGLAVVVLLYAAAHLGSANPVLVLAALVCGLWWGGQYLWQRSLLSNMISHALWDLMAFVWLPF